MAKSWKNGTIVTLCPLGPMKTESENVVTFQIIRRDEENKAQKLEQGGSIQTFVNAGTGALIMSMNMNIWNFFPQKLFGTRCANKLGTA